MCTGDKIVVICIKKIYHTDHRLKPSLRQKKWFE